MSKFHNGPNGPGVCKATKGNCPFGGNSSEENHFDSKETAQIQYNKEQEEKNGLLPGIQYDEDEDNYDEVLDKKEVVDFLYVDKNLDLYNDDFEPLIVSDKINEKIADRFDNNPELIENEKASKEAIAEIYAKEVSAFIDKDNEGLIDKKKSRRALKKIDKLNEQIDYHTEEFQNLKDDQIARGGWDERTGEQKAVSVSDSMMMNLNAKIVNDTKEQVQKLDSKLKRDTPEDHVKSKLEENPKVIDSLYAKLKESKS